MWQAVSCRSMPDDEKVCPLRGTVQGLQAEMEDFRRGVERQLEDVLRLAAPLSRTVTDLQCENRRLREQVEKLSRQVEALSRAAGQSGEGQTRYSSHALLSVSTKAQVSHCLSLDTCAGSSSHLKGSSTFNRFIHYLIIFVIMN